MLHCSLGLAGQALSVWRSKRGPSFYGLERAVPEPNVVRFFGHAAAPLSVTEVTTFWHWCHECPHEQDVTTRQTLFHRECRVVSYVLCLIQE